MSTEYNFEPAKRRSGYIYPLLSAKDEFVPKTHIGMWSIFRNPNNKSTYMNEEHCQKIRYKTYNGVMELFKKYGSPDYADLFNYNIETLTEIGLNLFANHPKIRPLRNMIECFELKTKPTPESPQRRIVISFGISRQVIEYYGNTGCVPILGRSVKKTRDLVIFGAEEIKLSDKDSIKVDRSVLYRKFVDWCELQGVDQQEGILMALEGLMERYPLPDLLPTSEYDFITEFDRPLLAKRKTYAEDRVERKVRFSSLIYSLAEGIISRYNRDPKNLTKQMDFDTYMNNALHLLNSNMALKYQDPELYQEKEDTKQFIEDNKKHLAPKPDFE